MLNDVKIEEEFKVEDVDIVMPDLIVDQSSVERSIKQDVDFKQEYMKQEIKSENPTGMCLKFEEQTVKEDPNPSALFREQHSAEESIKRED